MRFVSKHRTEPAESGMENGQYIFFLGKEKYLSDSKEIFKNDFLIDGNKIISMDHDDGRRLVLATFSDGNHGNVVEVVDAYHASIFNEPFDYYFAWISGEETTTFVYLLFDEPKAHIIIRLKSVDKFFIFSCNETIETIQVYI